MSSSQINYLRQVAEKQSAEKHQFLEIPPDQSISYLESEAAFESIATDAYWPKWNSPWWHMLLLFEMGAAELIPVRMSDCIVEALNKDFLHFFPFREEEVPEGSDPLKVVACHCQLGTIYRTLTACGINVDKQLPWIRPWFLRYQLPDGGLNCDEAAYTKPSPKSSVVSTLPSLEAVLYCRDLNEDEIAFLDRGASYLINKQLCRASSGRVINEDWLKLCFPRFYHYDILRGLSFLLNWSLRLKRLLPVEAVYETVGLIDRSFPDGTVRIQRSAWQGSGSRFWQASTMTWTRAEASDFELLKASGKVGSASKWLTTLWSEARALILQLFEKDLIQCVHGNNYSN